MRSKFLFAAAVLLAAGPVAAQKPQYLPTSKNPAPVASAPDAAASVVPPALTPENALHLDLSNGGRVTIQLRPDIAPRHVERMKTLVRRGFYNGHKFHRVIEGFMAQTGDPTGTGTGGSELPDLEAEFNILPHVRGTMSAARADDVNSANSQFFIMLAPRLTLNGKYSAFGRVVSGMEHVDAIEKGEPPANPTRIVRASIGADNIAPPRPGETVPVAPEVAAAEGQQAQAPAAPQ